ncbi:MAG: hydroxymethylglutaryl-CoA synthase [Dehalococcoidia bacterium]|nr:hydroxymethylglutaryl-CoA synthase [Dehalococcoidia bacterium]
MVGIVSYGAYIPIYRLKREELSRVWAEAPQSGEKAVANFDEDSITLAVEAGVDCLNDTPRDQVEALYFATTNPPYKEKLSASIIAAALDLRGELFSADFATSIRGGTMALRTAMDAINAGSSKNALVVAADCRTAAPNSESEHIFGDGGAALLLGKDNVAVKILDSLNLTSEFMDFWRTQADRFNRTWEDRFITEEGYQKILPEAVKKLMQRNKLTPKDIHRAVFYAPDARRHQAMARILGFDPNTQVQDPLLGAVGNTGAASVLMALVAALEDAKAGQKILLANYGDGADVFLLETTELVEKIKDRRAIKKHLAAKMALPSYGKYIKFRALMEWEAERRDPDRSALTVLWRERNQVWRAHGNKCKACGTIQFPIQRICGKCHAKDNYEEVRLSGEKGKLFTFSMDERAVVADLPNVMSIVDFDNGGRFYCILTDRDPAKIEINMPVELTFRNLHDGSGIHNYYWKARPVRC